MTSYKSYFFLCILGSIGLINSCSYTEFAQGKRLYERHCGDCHMNDGSGVVKLYPSLINSTKMQVSTLPCIIRYGQKSNNTVVEMEGIPDLSEVEINNIINYLLNDLTSSNQVINMPDTKRILEQCGTDQ